MGANLAEPLKAAAIQLGFDLVGITTADPPDAGRRIAAWIEAGRHGEMSFMARTARVRTDPGLFQPGAASVVCVAMAYDDTAEIECGRRGATARVAAYAARPDYHKVIKKALVRLGRTLSSWVPRAAWRAAVDSSPVAEKALAERAGLGFIGANTLLTNRELGSRLLLGELVTDVPLPPDEPAPNLCGDCHACVAACPTGALDAPHQLDARRCIAYLTVEHRGELPENHPSLHGYLFGCDLCQRACPFNVAPARCGQALAFRPELVSPRVDDLLGEDERTWRCRTAGTPLSRLDFTRLQRNLAALRHVEGNLDHGL
jgi:epoxyqueuosine reductase